MTSQPPKPHVLRPLIFMTLGSLLLTVGVSSLAGGSLLYGRHHPVVVTAAADPAAFWFGILSMGGFGFAALGVAVADVWSLCRYYTGGGRVERRPANLVSGATHETSTPDEHAIIKPSMETPLKRAFAAARIEHNIDLVLPVLKDATLHVIVGSAPQHGQQPKWFLTCSLDKERFCVTTAESEEALASIPWPQVKLSGAELLQVLPVGIEIIVLYAGAGADYLSREQLA